MQTALYIIISLFIGYGYPTTAQLFILHTIGGWPGEGFLLHLA
jgi:hypothetical protein